MRIQKYRKNNEPKEDTINKVFMDNDILLKALFADVSTKVGLFPVEVKDVRFFADTAGHSNLNGDFEGKVLYAPKYYQAQMEAPKDFIKHNLKMLLHLINVDDFQMCVYPKNKFLQDQSSPWPSQ